MKITRRTVAKGIAAASLGMAMPAVLRAQTGPLRIGFLTVKTGPLASGGIQMEQGLTLYLKERNNTLAGRPVELHTGDSGGAPAVARTKMKFVANLLVAINNVASAEAMVLGMKAGLDPGQIFDLISIGAGNSRVFELRAPMMTQNRYDGDNVTMKVSMWQKDMTVIGDFARSIGCPTPLFSATEPIYAAALSTGHGAEDTASVCAVLETMAGIKR